MDAEGQQEGEEEEEEDELLPSGSAAAAAQLLRDVRRLGEEALRVCRPEARDALRQVGCSSGLHSSAAGTAAVCPLLR